MANRANGKGLPVGRSLKLRWIVIFWMFVISAVSYLDRNNLSIAAGSIKHAFGLTDVQLGGVFSAFALGYALSQPFAGRVADRLGPRLTVAAAILWWSVFTALTPLVPPSIPHSVMLLVVVRLLLGIGESVIYPASNRLVAAWIPCSERGLANGLIFAGVGVGGGVAPPLITWIVVTLGWHWAFYASALLGLAIGVIWWSVVRDEPDQHPAITAQEQALIAAGLPLASSYEHKPGWGNVLWDRQVVLLTLSYFCFGYVAYIFFSWFFLYLSAVRGLDLKSSAILATLPFLAMTVFSTMGGVVSDWISVRYGDRAGRCFVAAGAMILSGLFVALATEVSDATVASIVLAGGAGALYVAQSGYWTLSASIGGRASGTVSGIINMGAQLGGVITASTTPIIAHALGWNASFLAAAGVALAGGLIWLLVDPRHVLRRVD